MRLAVCFVLATTTLRAANEPDREALLAQAAALDKQALALYRQGQRAQAVDRAEQALAIRRRLYPEQDYPDGHRELARSVNNLAFLRQEAGDLARAEAGYREALTLWRKLYPKERFPAGHAEMAGTLSNLGVLLRTRGQLVAAETALRDALAMHQALYPKARYPDGHADLAKSLHQVGDVLRARGQYRQAEPFFRQALAMGQKLYPKERFPAGHPAVAATLNDLGLLLLEQGNAAAAEPCLQEVLDTFRKLYPKERFPDGHPFVATALNNLGLLWQTQGELARAEPLFRQGLAMREKLYPAARYPAGHPELAASLNNLGLLLGAQGALAESERCHRAALAMREKLYPKERFPAGHPLLAQSLHNLGVLLRERGELAAAEPYARGVLAMLQRLYPQDSYPNGHPHLARALDSLGSLLQERGELAQAETLRRAGLAMRRQLYPPERFPAGHPDLAISLSGVSYVLRLRGYLAEAERCCREALAVNQALGHPDVATSRNDLAVLLQARGQLAEAERYYREGLAGFRKLYPPERFPDGHRHLALVIQNLGAVLQARGRPAEAEPLLREALAMRQHQLDAFLAGAAEVEALNFLATLPLTRDSYLTVTRDRPGAAAAYDLIWQGKGAVARWLGRRRLAAATDPETRALAGRLAEKRQALAALLLAPVALSPAQAQRVGALSEEKERLEKELAQRLPAFAAQLRSAKRTPDELRPRLPQRAALVDLLRYVHEAPQADGQVGRRTLHYVAFVLSRDRPVRRVELGPAAPIERAVADWGAALTKEIHNPQPEIRKAAPAAALRQLVWVPLARELPAGTDTVYLAPDGALTQLPWAALPGAKAGTVLLEEHALAVVPHGQVLLDALDAASRGREPPNGGTLLAIGGVSYDQAPASAASGEEVGALRRARAPAGKLQWPALPGTAREVEHVLGLAGERRVLALRGVEASTARLLAQLPKARWAHLATHGFLADAKFRSVLHLSEKDYERSGSGEKIGVGARNPLVLSGLVLAGANRSGADAAADRGILTAEAIAGMDLDGLELAVLSACDTGLGEVAGGEGVFGLQRAFHIAGAKNVIASLWQVDDEATAALMGLFYHHLWVEKRPPLEALRQAQLTLYRHPERIPVLVRERGPDFAKAARLPATPPGQARAATRLWAGFVLSGAGR
jgi:CHAT domain-containing protein